MFETALTRGVSAIVMGPVSSTSTPQVLRVLKKRSKIPIAFAGSGRNRDRRISLQR